VGRRTKLKGVAVSNCSKESKQKYNRKLYSSTQPVKRTSNQWTEEEIELIKDPSVLDRDLSKKLGRSLMAIQGKRCLLRKNGHHIPSKGTQKRDDQPSFSNRVKARQILKYQMRAGRIKEEPCKKCGSTEDVNAHHEDYSKPLDVVWLCRQCHLELHNNKLIEEREVGD